MPQNTRSSAIRAVIYARISLDRHDGAGVERQEAECRQLAERNGWEVTHVYVDNSVSAYSGKDRPEYTAMLAAIRAGRVDVVLAWHPDRLTRRLKDLVEYVDVTQAAGVDTVTVTAGAWDLSSASGRMTAQILGAVAEQESAHKGERIAAATRQAKAAGRWRGTGKRLFGYDQRGNIVEAEARHLRRAAERLLAGDTFRRVVMDMAAEGVTTTAGAEMTTTALRHTLLNPTIAGYTHQAKRRRDHSAAEWERISAWDRLGIIARGQWEPILEPEVWEALWTHLTNPARRTNTTGSQPAHLLSGIALCGTCGAVMYARKKHYTRAGESEPARVYYCKQTGGGHPTRIADPLDRYVTDLVLARLSRGDVLEALAENNGDAEAAGALAAQRDQLRQRLADLEDQATLGNIAMDQFGRMNAAIGAQLAAVEGQLVDLAGQDNALGALAAVDDVRQWWVDASLDMRREVIRTLLTVTVEVTPRHQNRFNPEYVTVEWKA